jgi:3' terminal RNA ribose 2'-O-methyltransferase Hen1
MLLTLTTTATPASDLGFLLAKHPEKVQTFSLAFGDAHVFYSEATRERCTAHLLLDVDPIRLSRRNDDPSAPLEPYVNDRPYAASSFLSVAIAQVLGSALGGRCRERPELAETAIPLEATLSCLACHGGSALLERLFAPLGYEVEASRLPLDTAFPTWGDSAYHAVRLRGTVRLRDLLAHLYVLVPVLDDEKHYWVGLDEVEKLVRQGEGWLATHPERETIASRYLRRQRQLVRSALDRLAIDEGVAPDAIDAPAAEAEQAVEGELRLDETRIAAVASTIVGAGAKRVLDLGCGEGKLVRALLREKSIAHVAGFDVSLRALRIAHDRLRIEELPPAKAARVSLSQASLGYRDRRFEGFDAAALVEVIEHVDPSRLDALERVVFAHARPSLVVVTTPNAEYNALFTSLPAGRFRHPDHRFEWTRAELAAWAQGVAARRGYRVRIEGIGPADDAHGCPTQMAIFELAETSLETTQRAREVTS